MLPRPRESHAQILNISQPGRSGGTEEQEATVAPPPEPPPLTTPSRGVRIRRNIPHKAKAAWGEAVTAGLINLHDTLDRGAPHAIVEKSLSDVMLLPSSLLKDSKASRTFHARLKRRTRAREIGPSAFVPQSRATSTNTQATTIGSRPAMQKTADSIHRMMALGSCSRAAKLLDRQPLVDVTCDSISKLAALNPPEPIPTNTETAEAIPELELTEDMLDDIIRKMPKGSASGRSGWTYEHVAAAWHSGPSAKEALLLLFQRLICGRLPHLPDLLDATLIGLAKPNGGVRPIALEEAILRVGSKCAAAACPEIGPALGPLQLGVGIPGGCEAGGHALRAGLRATPDCITVQIDFKNAFNCIFRSEVIKAVTKRCPKLLPVVKWLYAKHTSLHIRGAPAGTAPILSQRGVRQGNPLSSLLFAVVLQDALEAFQEKFPLLRIVAVHDDVAFQADSVEETIEAIGFMKSLTEPLGLEMVATKCGAHCASTSKAEEVQRATGITVKADGIVFAGTPIGSDNFTAAFADSAAEKVCEGIDTLVGLPLPRQDMYALLRLSFQQRLAHLTRTLPWNFLRNAIHKTEDRVHEVVMSLTQQPSSTWTENQRKQLCLPIRLGGVGLRDTTELLADACRLSAAGLAQGHLTEGHEALQPFKGESGQDLISSWHRLVASNTELWNEQEANINPESAPVVLRSVQQDYSKHIATKRYESLLNSCCSSRAGKKMSARLKSLACRQSGAWLTVLPIHPAVTLSNQDFSIGLRQRLGVPQMQNDTSTLKVTCFCGTPLTPQDIDDHAMTCKALSGTATMRHDKITGFWCRLCRKVGRATSLEPRLSLLKSHERLQEGRHATAAEGACGDILTVKPGGIVQVLDTSITHPAADTYMQKAATEAGAAAKLREISKIEKYAKQGQHCYQFVPLVTETYGRLGTEAMKFLNELADEASTPDSGIHKADFVRSALTEMSIALVRGNALKIRACQQCYVKASGNRFRPGVNRPTCDIDFECS